MSTPMHIPPMRPEFKLDIPHSPDQSLERLSRLVINADYPINGRIVGHHLMLVIPPARRHFWSPWLHLDIRPPQSHDDDPENPSPASLSALQGRFSPNPSVWTGFMLGYIALGTLTLFSALFGFAQMSMKSEIGAIRYIPIFVALALLMYWASLIGQRIAKEQMHELYDAVVGALKDQDATDASRTRTSDGDPEN